MASELSHFDEHGASRMVDISGKPITKRKAAASGAIEMLPETLERIASGGTAKGNVLEVARLAGIMAAKRTADLIPLCHPLALTSVNIAWSFPGNNRLLCHASCETEGQTGVEMEALTAVSIACLTVYDMCKGIDRAMRIGPIQLETKSGGKSGSFERK